MKPFIFTLAIATVVALSSCSSAYKTGQTPDDLYFSPVKAQVQDEYVSTPRQNDRLYQGSDEYYEDRFLRMRAGNPYRWSYLDDYYFSSPYGYNAFRYSDPWGWNSPWNNYWSWNYYYNPYYGGFHPGFYGGGGWGWGGYGPGVIVVGGTKVPRVSPSRPIAFTPNSYSTGGGNSGRFYNANSNNNNRMMNSYRGSNFQGYNNTNSGNYRNNGRSSNSNSYNNNNNSQPSRSYTPSSSNSGSRSSGSGSSGSGGGVSRPGRR